MSPLRLEHAVFGGLHPIQNRVYLRNVGLVHAQSEALLSRLSAWKIERCLHVGGGGVVYDAVDRSTQRRCALKMPAELTARVADAFSTEIATLVRLNQAGVRGVVEVVACGVIEGVPWCAMELIDGSDLASFRDELWFQSRSPMPSAQASTTIDLPSAVADFGQAACDRTQQTGSDFVGDRLSRWRQASWVLHRLAVTLDQVHELGLIHGDLSPTNVLLRQSREPVLLDFGASTAIFEPGRFREVARRGYKTRGTPGYAAPEVLQRDLPDARSDIYSLGCLAHELLLGRRPFAAASLDELIRLHVHGRPEEPIATPDELPSELADIVSQMLRKRPDQRMSSLREVARVFETWLGRDAVSTFEEDRSLALLRPKLRGRDKVLGALQARLEEARGGRGGMTLLRGPSGLGKTRLINEVALAAEKFGFDVVTCRCSSQLTHDATPESSYHGSGLQALLPLFRYLEDGLIRGSARQPGCAGAPLARAAALLRPYFPEFLRGVEAESLPIVPTDAAHHRLYSCLLSLVNGVPLGRPLLLSCDDVQWADELSSAFLKVLSAELPRMPVMVVCATRPENSEWLGIPENARVDLTPLDGNGVSDLARDLIGADVLPEGLSDFLGAHSQGNPFFVAEYTRAAIVRGLLRRERFGDWSFPTPLQLSEAAFDVPHTVDALLSERTRDLDPDISRVLLGASILSTDFRDADVAMLFDEPRGVELALRELVRRQVLESHGDGYYRFSHDKLRELQSRACSPEDWTSLHRRAAESLEQRHWSLPIERLARLGYHWSQAAEPERAVDLLESAASHAVREHSLELASALLRDALAQCTRTASPHVKRREGPLAEALGDVLVTRARHSEAQEAYERAMSGERDLPALARARIWRKRATSHWTLHDYAASEEALTMAEMCLRDGHMNLNDQHQLELIEIKLERAEQLYFSQRGGDVHARLIADLAPLVERLGEPRHRSYFFVAAASKSMLDRRYAFDDETVRLAREAVRFADGLPADKRALALLTYGFVLALGNRAACADALSVYADAAEAAEAALAVTVLARIRTYEVLTLLRLGHVERVIAGAERVREAAQRAEQPVYIAAASAFRGWAAWRQGDTVRGRELLDKARASWIAHRHPFPMRWVVNVPLLSLTALHDDLEGAQRFLEDLVDPAQMALPDPLERKIREALAAFEQSDPRTVARAIEEVLRIAAELGYC